MKVVILFFFSNEAIRRFSCIDINECLENNGMCEDICINTEGSFYCQCSTGLALSADNRTCEGKTKN